MSLLFYILNRVFPIIWCISTQLRGGLSGEYLNMCFARRSWRREAEPDAPALPAVPATPGSPDQLSSSATTVTTASPPSARAVGRALPVWRLEP